MMKTTDPSSRLKPTLLLLVAMWWVATAFAQQPNFVSITGTTAPDVEVLNRQWAYLLFEPTNDALLANKALAIYAKVGAANSPSLFTREGIVIPRVDAKLFAPLLDRASAFGENLDAVAGVLNDFTRHLDILENPAAYRLDRPGDPQPPFPPLSIPSNTPVGLKLELVLKKAAQHPESLRGIDAIKARHPGIAMCLGRAFACVMPQTLMTYEVREYDVATNTDIAVIGRVTLDVNQPVVLARPGVPVQVPISKAEDDLNIRLRWATPDALRVLGPQVQGYAVYRMIWAQAQALGWDSTAPSSAAFEAEVDVPGSSLTLASADFALNSDEGEGGGGGVDIGGGGIGIGGGFAKTIVPVLPTKLYSDANVGTFTSDSPTGPTYFFADDNRRYDEVNPGSPFLDQQEFGYLVRARDLLGRLGPPSRAGFAIACKTMPPDVVGGVTVTPTFHLIGGVKHQKVIIRWKSNRNAGHPRPTTHYEVLRTTNLEELTNNDGAPQFAPSLIINATPIAHVVDDDTMSFHDTTLETLHAPGQSVAYCVRAVRDPAGPCGPFYAAPSPPQIIALRDHTGPPAPIAEVVGRHCPAPFVGAPVITDGGALTPDGKQHFRAVCYRRDEQIAAVVFTVWNKATLALITSSGKLAFPPHGNTVSFDFTHSNRNLQVNVAVVGKDGSVSWPYWAPTNFADQLGIQDHLNIVRFTAGIVTPCGKQLNDPIATFSQGRVFKAGSAGVASYEFSPGVFITQVAISPAGGYAMTPGAGVNVTARNAAGGIDFIASANANGSNQLSFLDAEAQGMTEAQLMARYTFYTFDKTPVGAAVGEALDKDWVQLTIQANDYLPEGTQVCVVKTGAGGETLVGESVVRSGGRLAVQDRTEVAGRSYLVYPFLGAAITGKCPHVPAMSDGVTTKIMPVSLGLSFFPTSREYRIYRRINGGDLTMIAQGLTVLGVPGASGSEPPVQDIIRSDDSMPQVNCDICYYAQALDKNGNPSPMTLIECLHIGVGSSTPMPTPLIVPPKLVKLSSSGGSAVDLKWVCQPAGVDRFSILVVTKEDLAQPIAPPGGGVFINQTVPLFDAKTGQKQSFFVKETIITPRVGSAGMGSGPTFEYRVNVPTGNTYFFAVRALAPEKFDDEGFEVQTNGEWSQVVSEKVPVTPTAESHTPVPWPFRTLPSVSTHPDITVELVVSNEVANLYVMHPPGIAPSKKGVRIAKLGSSAGSFPNPPVGTMWVFNNDPNNGLIKIKDGALPEIRVLPAALYRQEIIIDPGTMQEAAPALRAPIVQCSPLISEIAYSTLPPGGPHPGKHFLNDPAIFGLRINVEERSEAFLMDKMPVRARTKYRYWLVHFDTNNEPDRVIYAGETQN
jgi:hypothetical protein